MPFCCYVYRLGDVQVGGSPGAVRGSGLAASDISDEGGEGGMGTGGEMPSSDCHVGPMLSSCTDNEKQRYHTLQVRLATTVIQEAPRWACLERRWICR
jgi:hypothetical protein